MPLFLIINVYWIINPEKQTMENFWKNFHELNWLDTLFDYLKNKILSAILDHFLWDMSVFSQIFTRGCAEVTCEKNMFLQRDQNM